MQLSPGTSRRRLVDPTQPPTLIEPETAVLWAGATVAGSRPASPAQPSLHYATDTPAVTLWDGSTWRSMGGATLPSASAAGQMLLSTGSGTSYAARARVLSGTLAERDALSPVREGDQWYVSSGSGSGTLWKRVNGAWRFRSMGATADDVLAELGAIKAPTSPTAGHVLTYDGSVWQSAAPTATPPSVTSEAMGGSGWTSSGSGTHSETWDGTKLDLAVTSSAGSAAVTKAGVIASEEYDILIRFSMPTNNATTQEQLYVAVGSASNKNTALAIKSNGSFDASRTNGGYVSIASPGGGPTGTQLTDGDSWLRLSKRSGTFAWYWARGSAGARPLAESWELVTAPSTNEAVMEGAAGDEVFLGAITGVSATIVFRVHAIEHCRPGTL